jgi:uncharacterized oligopeptide transporter (OPT) family protein
MQRLGDRLRSRRGRLVALSVLGVVFVLLPILFLFSGDSARLFPGALTRILVSMEQLLGVSLARTVFCGVWLAFGVALYWTFVRNGDREDA